MKLNAVVTASGRRLALGDVLGRGGEGTIFHVGGDNTIAVKVYTDGKAIERQAKLEAMIAARLHDRTGFVAFPVETVTANGLFVGFTMRKATGGKPIHQLCTLRDRKATFPDANFRFLVRVALNFARALASINGLGAIIGDVNESGALVDKKGLVTIIDSDSFQYRSSGKTFRCLVGKPEYTPPELQGQSLAQIERTVNHDAFGLAVIIFEILFIGRHPFSGIYRGSGDQPTISKAIQEGRFAYSPQRSQTQMEPPPHVPLLTDIPSEVATAFLNAFAPCGPDAPTRPTATDWVALLERMEGGILQCKTNAAHYYSRGARDCPWCRFENGTGTIVFVPHQVLTQSTFNLDYIVSKIEHITGPGPAPDLVGTVPAIQKLKPSQAAREYNRRRWTKKIAGIVIALVAVALMFASGVFGFIVLIPAGFMLFGEVSGAGEIRKQLLNAETQWASALAAWNRNVGSERFDQKKTELLRAAQTYRGLPKAEQEALAALETRKRDLQMQRFLENQHISRAKIDGIGDGRKMTLRSFGIETAWDISAGAVRAVPGFGSVLTGKLIDWRRSMEGRFVFNPNVPTDPKDITSVRARIAQQRSALETGFIQGLRELETIKTECLARRNDPRSYWAAYQALQQAKVDAAML